MILSQIFVKISNISDAIPQVIHSKAKNMSAFLLGFSLLIFCSCSTTRTIPIEIIHRDTLNINKEKYDSIYVYQDKYVDRSKDTILIKELQTEYRYKLLRDTIRIVQRDSIPYEVRITEVKEAKYIPPWTKALAYIGSISLLVLLIYIITKLKHF